MKLTDQIFEWLAANFLATFIIFGPYSPEHYKAVQKLGKFFRRHPEYRQRPELRLPQFYQ